MALSVVQSGKTLGTFASLTLTLIYGSTPIVGNLLVVSVYAFDTITAPAGWTTINNGGNNSFGNLKTFYHVVGVAEVNAYVFTIGSANICSLIGWEVTGQATVNPIDQNSNTGQVSGSPGSITTVAITPSTLGDLALASLGNYSNDGQGNVSAGWTIDQYASTAFAATVATHKNTLTVDTVTPISVTFGIHGGSSNLIAAAFLISPKLLASGVCNLPLMGCQ